VANLEQSFAWTPPPGWPAPPQGWSPPLGWQPDPDWPAVPPGHQWWRPTRRGLRRRRIAIVLVGLSNAVALLLGIYRIAVLTAQDNSFHQALRHRESGWYHSPSVAFGMTLDLIWLCSIALIIPSSSIGASELFGAGRGSRTRAAAFVAWLCVGVVCQYTASLLAAESTGSPFAPNAWVHDGRSWFAVVCLLSIVVFAGAIRLLKPARVSRHV
jgi:hypothetical protein